MSSRSNAASDMTSQAWGKGCCKLSQKSISDRTKAGIFDPRPAQTLPAGYPGTGGGTNPDAAAAVIAAKFALLVSVGAT